MDYSKKYNDLIESAKKRGTGEERHHIIPKCIGGPDSPENLVLLEYKEHYIAHLLLARIHAGSIGLVTAAVMMGRVGSGAAYVSARTKFADLIGGKIRDTWAVKSGFRDYNHQCDEFVSDYLDGVLPKNIATRYGVSVNRVYGAIKFACSNMGFGDMVSEVKTRSRSDLSKKVRSNFTVEQENRRIAAVKMVDRREYAARLSVERVGVGNPMYGRKRISEIIECPHCAKTGAASQMKRWHFNNCKEKNGIES